MKQIIINNNRFYMNGWMSRDEYKDFMQIDGAEYDKKADIKCSCPFYSVIKLSGFARMYGWEYDEDEFRMIHNFNELQIESSQEKENGFYSINPDLYDFQSAGTVNLSCILLKHKNALLADEMGLGKTVQAIELINYINPKSVLIVCPASLRLNWKSELETWLKSDKTISIPKTKFDSAEIIILNYAKLQKFAKYLEKVKFDLVIFDESHYLKNPAAKRTKLCFGARKVINAKYRLFMTGTPIMNRPIELFPLLKDCKIETNRKRYTVRFCDAKEKTIYTPAGRKTVLDVSGNSNEEDLQKILRSTIMVRRQKKDVLTQLPEKIQQIVFLPENGSIKEIRKERLEFAEKLKNPDLALAIMSLSEIRKENALRKIKFAKEYIENILEQKEKIIIFAWHLDVISELKKVFEKYKPLVITGGVSENRRHEIVEEFQNGDNRIFIGNIKAAGTGLTLTAASDVVFLEMDWTPGNNTQAEDRIHRIGQNETCHVHYLVYEDTVDAFVAKKVARKKKIIEKILDK